VVEFRAIPSLILQKNNFVKGNQFKNHRYVGDPRNIIKIFNDKDVDEIVIVNPFVKNLSKENLYFLSKVLSHCFLPITYGGGIKNISDIENLNRIGVEKYLFKYTNDFDISFLKEVSSIKGQQSIVLHIPFIKIQDKILLKKKFFFNKYLDMDKLKKISKFAGEIVFTDVTREGLRKGIDSSEFISDKIDSILCPVLYQGGVRNSSDLKTLKELNFSGALVGASYIFAGSINSVNIGYFREEL